MSSFIESVGQTLQEWEDMDDETKKLYNEALELVRGDSPNNTVRLREIFETHKDLDINKQMVPVYGETLLYQAVEKENIDMVKTLLDLGADVMVENGMGRETPISLLEECDLPEYEARNEVQQEIYKLLKAKVLPEACSNCGRKPSVLLICSRCKRIRYCSKECQQEHWKGHKPTCKPKVTDPDEELKNMYENAVWALGEDPNEVKRYFDDADNIIGRLMAQDVYKRAEQVMKDQSPEDIAFYAKREKKKHECKKELAALSEDQRALVKEAYEILEMTEEEQLNYESAPALVARIKEIFSKPGMNVNLPSEDGDHLLTNLVRNYCLGEKHPEAQLELVKFMLDNGADPNLEDCTSGTALDYLDSDYEFEELNKSSQLLEIFRLLKNAGGMIRGYDNDGKMLERGDTIGRHAERMLRESSSG